MSRTTRTRMGRLIIPLDRIVIHMKLSGRRVGSGVWQSVHCFLVLSRPYRFPSHMKTAVLFASGHVNPHILDLPQTQRVELLPWFKRIRERKIEMSKQFKDALVYLDQRDITTQT
jgi:hypothetical protein